MSGIRRQACVKIPPSRLAAAVAAAFIFFMEGLLTGAAAHAAWPTESQWIGVYKNSAPLQDPNGDTNGSRNIVSDADHWAAMVFYDGTYFYCRLRLDDDPSGTGGQGYLQPYGWGVEFDTDQDDTDFEWLTLLDGISQTESIRLYQNTVQRNLGDPGDQLEVEFTAEPLAGNYQIYPADSSFNPQGQQSGQDYWIAWRFPYDTLKTALGIADNAPIRLFFGSSSSANTLSENGADLCGGSGSVTLAQGLSDYIILGSGKRPTAGSVMFVEDMAGTGDMAAAGTGDTLYVKVADDDPNHDNASLQSVQVVLSVPSGDSETMTLTETGVDTGIFTAAISNTVLAAVPSYTVGNGLLEALPEETVTVTYVDAAAPNADPSLPPDQDVPRTDVLQLLPPSISVSKTVDAATVNSGGTVTYTITITNSGAGAGVLTSVADTLPPGFAYAAGSTSGLTAYEPVIAGQTLTWSGRWVVPRNAGVVDGALTLSFQATVANPAGTYDNNVTISGANFSPASTGDTAPVTVMAAPRMVIVKSVDKAAAAPGEELTYTVHYHNEGYGPAYSVVIIDTVPPNTTYVPGSLRAGDASSTYDTAAPRTDAADGDEAEVSGGSIIFRFSPVSQDDGTPNSGPDEGKVYLKLLIDS